MRATLLEKEEVEQVQDKEYFDSLEKDKVEQVQDDEYFDSPAYEFVAHKSECNGAETKIGYRPSPAACAEACLGKSSMFVFGTNRFGTIRCASDGQCMCYCETASTNGKCNNKRITHAGYNLYRYPTVKFAQATGGICESVSKKTCKKIAQTYPGAKGGPGGTTHIDAAGCAFNAYNGYFYFNDNLKSPRPFEPKNIGICKVGTIKRLRFQLMTKGTCKSVSKQMCKYIAQAKGTHVNYADHDDQPGCYVVDGKFYYFNDNLNSPKKFELFSNPTLMGICKEGTLKWD